MRTNDTIMNAREGVARLETPQTVGFRVGMSSSTVIGRKLERIYDLPSDTPREIGELLKVLDSQVVRAG